MSPTDNPASDRSGDRPAADYEFSYGRFVLTVLGSGVAVLVVSVPIIIGLVQWNRFAGLVAALIAVAVMIAVMGYVSRRLMGKVERAILAAREKS
ncbi:MAG: hypothetical protein QM662_19010 [Gordonia sp. (in: high G+C Gram-positive bacteria)]